MEDKPFHSFRSALGLFGGALAPALRAERLRLRLPVRMCTSVLAAVASRSAESIRYRISSNLHAGHTVACTASARASYIVNAAGAAAIYTAAVSYASVGTVLCVRSIALVPALLSGSVSTCYPRLCT